jgi:hypothetical protein
MAFDLFETLHRSTWDELSEVALYGYEGKSICRIS